MSNRINTVAEAAPQLRKTEAGLRWYLRQPDCPLKTIRMGSRIYVTQSSIDSLLAGEIPAAS
ncbi:hypothetical protein EDF28_3568 [Curtobacterium sp. PhB137]|uniref:hypothetical protein n=1 Tax=Curtobacterium sp. PhB137 TaxID=2485182 RepID=UPI000F514493|nr:hypothetical protein [Curtobacterium sp. PhB137]RPE75623.1 hypothetical protein EDF28_3568 [Curtobacterium sp. PhB137]